MGGVQLKPTLFYLYSAFVAYVFMRHLCTGYVAMRLPGLDAARSTGVLVSVSPLIVAMALEAIWASKYVVMALMSLGSKGRLGYRFLYPFHKESLLGKFGFHTVVGTALTVVPVYHAVVTALAPSGESVYYTLYGGGVVAGSQI